MAGEKCGTFLLSEIIAGDSRFIDKIYIRGYKILPGYIEKGTRIEKISSPREDPLFPSGVVYIQGATRKAFHPSHDINGNENHTDF